jgi:DNA-binding transcriptional MerR regulator
MEDNAKNLLGALIQISLKAPLRLLFISRTTLRIYDRRDVHTRKLVREMPLSGLSLEDTKNWLDKLEWDSSIGADKLHEATGGHPLALELLELYGQATHEDWLRFLDEEILTGLPKKELELLSTLSVSQKPIPWERLASAVGWSGPPPENLIKHGLLVELDDGMWLHEAIKERLLRDVGDAMDERKSRIE